MSTLNVTNISDGTNSTATTNVVKGSAKAWVNFNGTGTVAIREAYNVSSITDVDTGKYTVNFTTAMPDANYCAQITGDGSGAIAFTVNFNTTSIRADFVDEGNASPTTYRDPTFACVAILR